MFTGVRRVRGRRIARALLGLGALLVSVPSLPTEPSGHVLLVASWVEEEPRGIAADERTLRLELHPLVSMRGAALTVSAPSAIELRPLTPPFADRFRSVPPRESESAMQVEIGRLDSALGLEFEVVLPQDGSGIVSFVLEADGPDGRRHRDALGFAVRAPRTEAERRLGAVEFPAAVVAPTGSR